MTFSSPPQATSEDVNSTIKTFFCPNDTYNDMATLFFNSQESAILQLFHQDGECQCVHTTHPRGGCQLSVDGVTRLGAEGLERPDTVFWVCAGVCSCDSSLLSPRRDFQPRHFGLILRPLFPAGMLDFRHLCPQWPLRAFPAVWSSLWTLSCQHLEKVVW